MKLKTEMVGPDSTSEGPYPAARESDDGQGYLHDAAAAHALMRVMSAYAEYFGSHVKRIQSDASEILREWGFDSGEVAGDE